MAITLTKITIKNFKRIETLNLDLRSITALIGGNTSGKSSALQAAQLGISVLQAALRERKKNKFIFFATVANDAVLFRPTQHLLDLRRGGPATQNDGYEISYEGLDEDTKATKSVTVGIKRGKNANITLALSGDNDFQGLLADRDHPFSIFTPGLSGIPMREEWRTKGAMDAAVMHGDANLYLRTVLDHLFNLEGDAVTRGAWVSTGDILGLPDGKWKTFSKLLDECYPGARVIVEHDPQHHRQVNVRVNYAGAKMTLDMASTGMLQVIQILAYACFYAPPLLLLDEPDAHLHADSQSRLYDALRGIVTETPTRVIFASHSPQLIQRILYDDKASVVWMRDGAAVEVDDAKRPAVPLLMSLGALASGADIFDPHCRIVLLTEDELTEPVKALAKANGAPPNLAVLSYNSCENLSGARALAKIIVTARDDVRVVIHRDRDFRTDTEMEFERLLVTNQNTRRKIERTVEIFTELNDVEHQFAKAEHLKIAFNGRIAPGRIDQLISEAIAFRRDEMTGAAGKARNVIEQKLYKSDRKRGKPEWGEVGMPAKPPALKGFIPENGLVPVAFEKCHGKRLLQHLRMTIHAEIKGDSKALEGDIFRPTVAVESEIWKAAFALPAV
jgi:predicted ATPase